MKKNFFLNFSLQHSFFYRLFLYYNLYLRNFKYLIKESHSQFGEDIFILKYFSKKKGFYIDIGCHHPFRYNNTFNLYKIGWSGLNIDLNKISIDLFEIMRPRDKNICSIISDKEGKINFYVPNKNLLSPEITIEKKFSKKYKKLHGNSYEAIESNSVTWQSIEKKYKRHIKKVDFLKIDIEGSDLKVLKSINLTKLKPTLIMTEAPDFEKISRKKIIKYLKSKNYIIIYDNSLNIIFKKK
jgi:FkbM family methyltransferase